MGSLRRILRLWALYGRMDVLWLARSTSSAVSYYLGDAIIGSAAITATFLLAQRFDGIPPWSKDQVLFLLGYALLVRGSVDVFFNFNVAFISRRIGRGQLDHLLVQPQPLWMALLTEGFAPLTGAGMVVPGMLLLGWSMAQLQVVVTPVWLAQLGLYLVCSIGIVLAFSYACATLAFWAPRGAEELNSSTWQLIMQLDVFPLDALPTVVVIGLLTVVPVGLVAWIPARTLLGLDGSPVGWLALPTATLIFVTVCAWLFGRGLARYGRTGSTRYLSYGHRR